MIGPSVVPADPATQKSSAADIASSHGHTERRPILAHAAAVGCTAAEVPRRTDSRFLDAVGLPKHRVILTVCYAAGLRIFEAVRLTPAAIDSQRTVIRIEEGKGRKDRRVMHSPKTSRFVTELLAQCTGL